MKYYMISYHLVGKGCCGSRQSPPTLKIRIEAENPEAAKAKLRELTPGARFETIEEISR